MRRSCGASLDPRHLLGTERSLKFTPNRCTRSTHLQGIRLTGERRINYAEKDIDF
jgi:hypothetical protein